ncbi:hypothetical protein GCM10022205_32780 [Spinactinospora alkalitolerans]
MATQVFTDEELETLRRLPEIGREELFRFFALTPADVALVDPGRGRLCSRPVLVAVARFVPDDVPRPCGRRWCTWRSSLGWIRTCSARMGVGRRHDGSLAAVGAVSGVAASGCWS